MTAIACLVVALLGSGAPAPAGAVAQGSGNSTEPTTAWVLPPGQEAGVRQALDFSLRAPDGALLPLASISLDRTEVHAAWEREKRSIVVRLVHPSVAPAGAVASGEVAVVPAPGTPRWAVEQVAGHLREQTGFVRWAHPAAARQEGVDAKRVVDQGENWAGQFDQIEQMLRRGDEDEARRAVRGVLDRIDHGEHAPSWARVSLAALLMRLGQVQAGKRLARTALGSDVDMWARAVLGTLPSPPEVVDGLKSPCDARFVARILASLGRLDQAIALQRHVAAVAPECKEVTQSLIRQLLRNGDTAAARSILGEPAGEKLGNSGRALLEVEILKAEDHIRAAARLLERVLRDHPDAIRSWAGHLVALYSWGGMTRQDVSRWKSLLGKRDDHGISAFLLGVAEHYRGQYRASLAHLDPLAHDETWREVPRLYVYRAMDLFNLGEDARALALLDEAAKLPQVDPDVYYCRAEVLRDRDRRQALEDFRHYLALSNRPEETHLEAQRRKLARVAAAMRRLQWCVQHEVEVCEGPFEHPRARKQPRRWVAAVVSSLAGLAVGLVWAVQGARS